MLKPGAVTDIYNLTNDSVQIAFTTAREDSYGRILLTIQATQFPLILQVLDEKDNLIATKNAYKQERVVFDYLKPGKYRIKAVSDENSNGKWDTGNFRKHLQPEKVFFNDKAIDLRSNWDHEVLWNILE